MSESIVSKHYALLHKGDCVAKKKIPSSCNTPQERLDERILSPRAKALLEELSKELGLSKETVAELARTMYRLYKDKE